MPRLALSVDFATGSIIGEGADEILDALAHWEGYGYVYGTQLVEIADPLASEDQFVPFLACLGYYAEESPFLPSPVEIPSGAVA